MRKFFYGKNDRRFKDNIMINYNFINYEEKLLHVIRTGTTSFEDYKEVVKNTRYKLYRW